MSTIYAVASGRPPAAIVIIRISGPHSFAVAERMIGPLPEPRYATLRAIRDEEGALLDRALVLTFPGPNSVTGEDVVEFHCHGGGAVVRAVEARLGREPGLRQAEPGEFTRRGLFNDRLDVLQVEALADLLSAETETQRRAAIAGVEGKVSTMVRSWMDTLTLLSARLEVMIDYADEEDGAEDEAALCSVREGIAEVVASMRLVAEAPSVERLGEPITVAIAGPPNAGKSTLFNMLAERDLAIVSPRAGTTRDRLEATVLRSGRSYRLIDTAGLHDDTADEIEQAGIARAQAAAATSDVLLWTGDDPPPRNDAIWLHMRADLPNRGGLPEQRDAAVSVYEHGSGMDVWQHIAARRAHAGIVSEGFLRSAQQDVVDDVVLRLSEYFNDLLLVAEQLRAARSKLGQMLRKDTSNSIFDMMFSRFCLGK